MSGRIRKDLRALAACLLLASLSFGCAQSRPPAAATATVDMSPTRAEPTEQQEPNVWARTKTVSYEKTELKTTRPFEPGPMCTEADPAAAQFLFVQNAEVASVNGQTLTLHHVSPDTVYFSDRPKRVAGRISTKEWVDRWGSGSNSFLDDPPNASLTCDDGDRAVSTVIELMSPELSGDNLSYRILAINGTLPDSCQSARLFIDGGPCVFCP